MGSVPALLEARAAARLPGEARLSLGGATSPRYLAGGQGQGRDAGSNVNARSLPIRDVRSLRPVHPLSTRCQRPPMIKVLSK